MPLKTFATLDEIPEDQRAGAIETKDGKFLVAVDEDTTGLKNSVAASRRERDEAKKRAKDLEDELAELKAKAEASSAGVTSDKLAEIQRKAEEKFKPQLDELAATKVELRKLRLDGTVKGLLSKDAVDADAAWKILGDEFDLTDDGKAILKADPTTDIAKYIDGPVRQKYPFLFKGSQADGGGAGGGGGSGKSGSGKKPTEWSSDERRAFIEQHGQDAYRKLLDQSVVDSMTQKQTA